MLEVCAKTPERREKGLMSSNLKRIVDWITQGQKLKMLGIGTKKSSHTG